MILRIPRYWSCTEPKSQASLARELDMTVGDVLHELVRHPVQSLVLRWNWKSAITSAFFRASIFFVVNATAGPAAAVRAMGIEFCFRAVTSGFYGAITQSFRRAEPAWAASLTAMLLVPAVTHSLEFLVHWMGGTRRLTASVLTSALFSAVSTTFNLFAMRRGVLIVGEDRRPLRHDLI